MAGQEKETADKAVSKTGWKKRSIHEGITCPSGAVIDIQIPNLPSLIKAGRLPNHLIELAAGATAAAQGKLDEDFFSKEVEFTNHIVAISVVNPKLTPEEVEEVVPYEDQQFIARLAMRQEDMDALGRHIGGLHKQDEFRAARALGPSYAGFEGI